ncbi:MULTISPECIES: hypothetical protein [unclassified Paracoccus (in: a-proteobacteria)]|uniref:hypothetical protein n=1 Tax=unclassified Paracoccus (in: a-proteobacteria) TaxID=2688777 RepID=UPI0012B2BEEF|nr:MULTISPECIES: hypothetical protein [unclassified Paracoccus (in: a-proteobacteria)]UXU75141.1 hypothetical protein GB879_001170 [Paracoccus sp. SMMA_5]UXU81043.1 hypothetical protein GB880_001165 [Paracoccus sp. SMMA_5_TC]
MIGVILWSSPARQKAVIWCEDHGALAYLKGTEDLMTAAAWPEAGDLVELEVEMLDGLRHARAVHVVDGNRRPELPGLLRSMSEKSTDNRPVLRVIPGGEPEYRPPLKVAAAG